jgi:mono/diheme cytochrome c family protein
MSRRHVRRVAAAIAACAAATVVAEVPRVFVSIDQKVDQATLTRYHHTDQGTRIMPAAFLEALVMADGSGKLMETERLRGWGFLVDDLPRSNLNPYRWPLGFTVSDPATSGGVSVAGVTCALCHTGQLEYSGTAIRIEGGQPNINLPAFQSSIYAAIRATALDPASTDAFLKRAVAAGYPADRARDDFLRVVATASELLHVAQGLTGVKPGPGRVDAVQGIANAVFATDIMVPANGKNFDAPVSYPYLWDIWRLSWLQYNSLGPPLPVSRNIGEVIGTSGRTRIVNPQTGALNPEPERWRSSVQVGNLIWLETVVKAMEAPTWPAATLGRIDSSKAARGRELFVENCAGCHGIKELPNGLWDVTTVELEYIGTDPNQATNWAGRTYDASKLGWGTVPASALAKVINQIRRQYYADNQVPASSQEPDVTMSSPCGYKARPLIGVWATLPFLHNGSVRTVFELLSDVRPTTFKFGTREFDPVNLGYVEDTSAAAAVLDTSIPGNRNTGHWWTDDERRPGRIGRRFQDDEKYALIEFLKAATYDNYPVVQVTQQQALPCEQDPEWARAQ